MHAVYWQADQKKNRTQNAIDIAMFLITSSAQNIYSAVLQTYNACKAVDFPYKWNIRMFHIAVVLKPFSNDS